MAIEIKIPHIGESISEVQIAEWLKAEGDEVKKDENIAVIDSEKTTFELPSSESGRLKILHQAGDTVKVGEAVAQIEVNAASEIEKVEPPKSSSAAKENQPNGKAVSNSANKAAKELPPPEGKKENPEAQQNAEEIKTEENTLAEEDESKLETPAIEEEKNGKPATPKKIAPQKTSNESAEKIVPMTMLRKTAAKRLVEAKQQMAMLTTFNEADMTAIQNLRKEFQEAFEKRHQTKLGFMSFFVKAVAGALKEFPQLNAEIRENDIVYFDRLDIGVAIASERGLVVPVLRRVDKMSFAEVEKTIGDFARRARDGKLKPDELVGGTFTITNGGVFGSLLSTPIINPPQTGILGMHTIQERPIAWQGQVVIRPMMYLALTYDHRIVDGREAVLFLRRVKEAVENPARMLMEI